MATPHFIYPSSVDGQSCFHFLAAVSNAAVNVGAQVCAWPRFPFLSCTRPLPSPPFGKGVWRITHWLLKRLTEKRHTSLVAHFIGRCHD